MMATGLMIFLISLLFVLSASTFDYSSEEEEDLEDNELCYYSAPPMCRRDEAIRPIFEIMCDCVQSMHETRTCKNSKIEMFMLSNKTMEIRQKNKDLDFVWNICIKVEYTYKKFLNDSLNFAMTSNDPIIPLAVFQIRHSNIDSTEDKEKKVMEYMYDNNRIFRKIYYKLNFGV